jgi:hypothetical protein
VSPDTPIESVDLVDFRPELKIRPRRASHLVEEHRAFCVLASEMATNPQHAAEAPDRAAEDEALSDQ